MASGSTQRTSRKARAGFGLLGMKERASLVGATIQIESARGRGTTILVQIAADGRTDING